jgi:hypothetical protein
MGFAMAVLRRLSRHQDDFELDKAPKLLDSIQVNPGSPNEEDFTLFCDDTPNRQNAAECVRERSRVVARSILGPSIWKGQRLSISAGPLRIA